MILQVISSGYLNYLQIERLQKLVPEAIIYNQKAVTDSRPLILIYCDSEIIEKAQEIRGRISNNFYIGYSAPIIRIIRTE